MINIVHVYGCVADKVRDLNPNMVIRGDLMSLIRNLEDGYAPFVCKDVIEQGFMNFITQENA